jgi:hypothetical protein
MHDFTSILKGTHECNPQIMSETCNQQWQSKGILNIIQGKVKTLIIIMGKT